MDETEINTDELSLKQKIEILMTELPAPVQDFLRSPERDQVSLELSTKYSLHADQAGVFSRAYIYMLLGVYTPEEFVQELRDAGVAEVAVQGLTQDVNERVFKRLQNAERNPNASTPPAAPSAAPVPVALQPQAASVPQPVPPTPAPFAPIPTSAPIYVAPQQPAMRTMAQDMQMMAEEAKHPRQTSEPVAHAPISPRPTPAAVPRPISWQPSSPARSFQTSSVPNTLAAPSMHPAPAAFIQPTASPAPAPHAPIPAYQPVAPVPPQASSAPAAAFPPIPAPAAPVPHNLPMQPPAYPWQTQASTASSAAPRAQVPIIKEYGVDPYRETPE